MIVLSIVLLACVQLDAMVQSFPLALAETSVHVLCASLSPNSVLHCVSVAARASTSTPQRANTATNVTAIKARVQVRRTASSRLARSNIFTLPLHAGATCFTFVETKTEPVSVLRNTAFISGPRREDTHFIHPPTGDGHGDRRATGAAATSAPWPSLCGPLSLAARREAAGAVYQVVGVVDVHCNRGVVPRVVVLAEP